jgi:hypothetical protein
MPVRLQISWMKHKPSLRRADPRIADRLAVIEHEQNGMWTIVDDHGEIHHMDSIRKEVPTADPTAGRWVVRGPVPTYAVGERLILAWRYRNLAPGEPPKAKWVTNIIAEEVETLTVKDIQGQEYRILRVNGHEIVDNDDLPRWVIVGREENPPSSSTSAV